MRKKALALAVAVYRDPLFDRTAANGFAVMVGGVYFAHTGSAGYGLAAWFIYIAGVVSVVETAVDRVNRLIDIMRGAR